MKISLKQHDITLNQQYIPSYDVIKNDSELLVKYRENLIKRINKRINQINNLILLFNNNLTIQEYINIVKDTYNYSYNNVNVLKINLLSEDNLVLLLRVSSDEKLEYKKLYSLKEIDDLFNNNRILLESVFISEFDQEYSKEYLNNDKESNINVNSDIIGDLFISLNDKYNSYYNELIINDLKSNINKERIKKDIIRLRDFTITEINSIINKDKNEDVKLLR